jgi:tetratricopeptide (TPR) repeat protein
MKPSAHVAWMRRLQQFSPMIVATAVIANAPSLMFAIAGGMTTFVLTHWAARRVNQRWFESLSQDLFQRLNEAEDTRALAAPLDDINELYRAAGVPDDDLGFVITNSYGLLMGERWGEARIALTAIDRDKITDPMTLAIVENNLAWAMAHDHAAAPAEQLAQQALDRLRELPHTETTRSLTASCLGTLGIARCLADDCEEAIEPISQAIAQGGSHRSQQIRWFYLGLALDTLGRTAEAIDAWTRSLEHLPETRYGHRAADRLARLA